MLPFRPGGGSDQGGEAQSEEVLGLAEVDDVEDDPLVGVHVLHREVEPEPAAITCHDTCLLCCATCPSPVPRVARVWPHEQVVLKLIDEVHTTQVTWIANYLFYSHS